MIAHAVATTPADKDLFRKALALEADWGLGRNPLNIIEMTTATTPLAVEAERPSTCTPRGATTAWPASTPATRPTSTSTTGTPA